MKVSSLVLLSALLFTGGCVQPALASKKPVKKSALRTKKTKKVSVPQQLNQLRKKYKLQESKIALLISKNARDRAVFTHNFLTEKMVQQEKEKILDLIVEKVELVRIIDAMQKLITNNKTRIKDSDLLLVQLKKQRTDIETEVLTMQNQMYALDADRQRKLREYRESQRKEQEDLRELEALEKRVQEKMKEIDNN